MIAPVRMPEEYTLATVNSVSRDPSLRECTPLYPGIALYIPLVFATIFSSRHFCSFSMGGKKIALFGDLREAPTMAAAFARFLPVFLSM